MSLKYMIGILGALLSCQIQAQNNFLLPSQQKQTKKKPYLRSPLKNFSKEKLSGYINRTFTSAYDITKNVFTLNSMKVLVPSVPLYLSLRQADYPVHRQFYIRDTHTNKNQPSEGLKWIADQGIGYLYGGFILNGILNQSKVERDEFQLYSTGLLVTYVSKFLLKYIKADHNLRPWHEDFDADKRAYGGSPSGHTATMIYTTVFFGLSRGITWGLPLSLYSAYTMSILVTSNNHYVSQTMAGAALGGLIGTATYRVLKDIQMPKNMSTGLGRDVKGNLALSLAYDF